MQNLQKPEAHNKKLQELFYKLETKRILLNKLIQYNYNRYTLQGTKIKGNKGKNYDTGYVYAPYQPLYFSSP
jgi:hypothetical protein